MELKYKETPLSEGGAAVPGAGTIHRNEIRPTLEWLQAEMDPPFELMDRILGSVGKKEYSGDLDLVIDESWNNVHDFKEWLLETYSKEDIRQNGTMLHLKYPIRDYDSSLIGALPRTGFVQIDFNFGNPEWLKFYYYSAGELSEYKGSHRNIAISSIISVVNTKDNPTKDSYNRPITQVRWKWSPKGFMRVQRTSKYSFDNNIWMKKQDEDILDGPFFDPEFIAKTIFPKTGTIKSLSSLETIIIAVKENFTPMEQKIIWEKMARNFMDREDSRNFSYPPEIEPYCTTNDK